MKTTTSASCSMPPDSRRSESIGRPPGRQDPADFVLRDFAAAERKEVPLVLERAADAVEALLRLGLAPAQNEFHPAAPVPPADPATG